MSESDSFLARWSRRKRAARDAAMSEQAPAPPAAQDPAALARDRRRWSNRRRESLAQTSPEPRVRLHSLPDTGLKAPLPPGAGESSASAAAAADLPALSAQELASLPPLEELTAESDVTMFLRAGVPESLRNAALRQAWSLDPKIRDYVCEAREYAYDWNVPGDLPGNGPLPRDFDVKALVGRLFRDRPAATPPDRVSAPQQTATPARPTQANPPEDAAFPNSAGSGMADSLPADKPSIAAPAAATPADSDGGPDIAAAASRETASQPSRKRRHGGAIPL